MHKDSTIPGPTYITRFLHTDQSHAEEFQGLSASLVAANIAEWRPNLTTAVRDGCQTLIIDPVTHAYTYKGFLEKGTYTCIPYAPTAPLSARTLLQDPNELKQFTQRVLQFQLDQGADVLIAPYFYSRDLDDTRLTASLRMISEAANIRSAMGLDPPLYAWLCIGSIVMLSPVQVNEIAKLFAQQPVTGFFITIENLDDRSADAETLTGLAGLTRRLAKDHDVFPCAIGAFGQVLCALDANGFSAGIGWLETFREITLKPGGPPFAPDRTPRAQYYYIPELLTYVHPDALEAIYDPDTGSATMRELYRCTCEVCSSGLPVEACDKKRHFMIQRHQELEQLGRVGVDERPEYMKDRLQLALELAGIIEDEALVRIPTEHFIRWLAVIDHFSSLENNPTNDEALEELDQIVHETRQRHNDQSGA